MEVGATGRASVLSHKATSAKVSRQNHGHVAGAAQRPASGDFGKPGRSAGEGCFGYADTDGVLLTVQYRSTRLWSHYETSKCCYSRCGGCC